MGYISALICAFVAVLCLIKHKEDSPLFLYSAEWCVLSILPAIKLYGLYEIELFTWVLVIVGFLSYALGVVLRKKYIITINGKRPFRVLKQGFGEFKIFKDHIYISLVIILYITDLFYFFQSLLLMRSGISMADIRAASYGLGDFKGYKGIGLNSGGVLTYIYILKEALTHIIIAIGIYRFLDDTKRGKKFLFISLGLVVLIAFSNGSRFDIAYVILQLIFGLKLFNKKIELPKKIKKSVRLLLICGVIGIVFISIKRGVDSIFKTFYYYLASPVALLNIDLPKVVENSIYSFPYAAFAGFFAIAWPFFNKLGLHYTPRYLRSLNESVNATQAWVQIGDSLWSNAFVTPYYYLFSDARWIGLIVGMVFLGYFSQHIYINANNSLNEINTVYYLLVIEMLFRTLYQYPFTSAVNAMEIILLILVAGLKRKKGMQTWKNAY